MLFALLLCAIMAATSAFATPLPSFEDFEQPDLSSFYPGETAEDSTALWVKGAGTLLHTE